jgi:hypothetical protein
MATKLGHLGGRYHSTHVGVREGMGKARKRLAAFGSGVARVGKYTAVASIAAAAGLAVIIKNSMATIDVQAKTAVALGTTTEALVGLQHAGASRG